MRTERETTFSSLLQLTPSSRRCFPYVYIVICEGFNHYKIGISTMPPLARLSALQNGCPFKLTMPHVFATPEAAAIEKKIHRRLRSRRIHGEWFELSPAEVEALILDIADEIEAVEPVIRSICIS